MIFSLQLLTITLAATVAARPGDWDKGRKPGPNPPSRSTTTIATTTTAAITTTTKPPQPSSPASKFFPFWPFRGPNNNSNNKCWSDFKDCRRNPDSGSGACVSTYAACIGTQASSRMPATSVTSAPGGMPTFNLPHPLLPPLSHLGKHHGRVRKCNEAYWACRAQSGSQQSNCFSDLSTCLAKIGSSATSTGVPPSSTGSATVSATGTSVVAANPTGQDNDDDDDDDDDDSSPSGAT
ncbi:hypothetical protein B0J15DRAFT_563961 [Fusarium solani]|uniref:Uncharacterized protein n=1 Tax=Fusarium solani TaxID=169388 RepID=A0A9P9GWR2_FUSSL|nr:uncharacterized protein B0J15DRAFT_563961 [Fusarium solani]KAH7246994.1 hypothetical protein B0J15DRAFT_563961 [Fusarium solani]